MLARLLSCLLPAPRPETPASEPRELVQLATIAAVTLSILFTAKTCCPF